MRAFSRNPHVTKRNGSQTYDPAVTQAKAINWLGKILKHPSSQLINLVFQIWEQGSAPLYRELEKAEKNGGTRRIFLPNKHLRKVQNAINLKILAQRVPHVNTFGFSGGGNCRDVAERHKGKGSTLTFDVKNAFFQISHREVELELINAGLSCTVAGFVADLSAYRKKSEGNQHPFLEDFLPPGAPTSPRLFDLCCRKLDHKLTLKAERLGGVYSRYADNVFFSFPGVVFPPNLKKAILKTPVQFGFPIHKVRVVSLGGLCRILGYNVSDEKVANVRRYKRRFRKALHHLEFVLDTGLPHKHALSVVNGLIQFAVRESLPKKLLLDYQRCVGKASGHLS